MPRPGSAVGKRPRVWARKFRCYKCNSFELHTLSFFDHKMQWVCVRCFMKQYPDLPADPPRLSYYH
jgi:hypothetical protein